MRSSRAAGGLRPGRRATRPARAVRRRALPALNQTRPSRSRNHVARWRPAPGARTDRTRSPRMELVRVAALIGAAIVAVLVALPALVDLAATGFR